MKYTIFSEGIIGTNCVVLQQQNNCVVVDIPAQAHNVLKYVRENNLNVQAVLLTHGHFDHCGGVNAFLNDCGFPDAPIYVHPNDWQMCQTARQNRWGAPCENCFPTCKVVQGKLTVGDFCFDVLETPGHTMGSVVYIAEDLMLAGDTLFKGTVGRTDLPESSNMHMQQSLKKLVALSGDYVVICGHGPSTTLKYEKCTNQFLRALSNE